MMMTMMMMRTSVMSRMIIMVMMIIMMIMIMMMIIMLMIMMIMMMMMIGPNAWLKRKLHLRPQHRGVHLVTEEILAGLPELHQFQVHAVPSMICKLHTVSGIYDLRAITLSR